MKTNYRKLMGGMQKIHDPEKAKLYCGDVDNVDFKNGEFVMYYPLGGFIVKRKNGQYNCLVCNGEYLGDDVHEAEKFLYEEWAEGEYEEKRDAYKIFWEVVKYAKKMSKRYPWEESDKFDEAVAKQFNGVTHHTGGGCMVTYILCPRRNADGKLVYEDAFYYISVTNEGVNLERHVGDGRKINTADDACRNQFDGGGENIELSEEIYE